ncbi:Protein of unknown function DUF4112 [Penicillium brevicompactum]|uniref:Protein of unknown function DUF4112 n=1 Tax=Penicillium brevicompactum TaxID=5074 RepID=UPI00253F82D7|nr:Protein of unknown function DUF4112 [Penicillium brevicompactum]KAJ5335747.1 Protein of unknown function DUF4112 [Penicillium brevicompactum]
MIKALVLWMKRKMGSATGKQNIITADTPRDQAQISCLSRGPRERSSPCDEVPPPGLSKNDTTVLAKVKRRAYMLDYALFNLCGIHFGWGSVIGLVPLIGDFSDFLLATMVVRTCGKIDGGLPIALRLKMIGNIGLDLIIGLIPFIGDLADAIYKANTRNAHLLEAYLREKVSETA